MITAPPPFLPRSRLASATGTTTYTPGTYFTQTLNGAMSNTASGGTTPAYGVQTTTTPAGGAGATTTSGLSSPYYAVSLTGSQTSGWPFRYLGQSYDSLTGAIQGVVSGQQGAASYHPRQPGPALRQFAFHSAQPLPVRPRGE